MAEPLAQKEFLSRKECSLYITQLGFPLAVQTLAGLAANNNAGGGPPFYRVRWSRVYYKRVEVEAWVKAHTERVA